MTFYRLAPSLPDAVAKKLQAHEPLMQQLLHTRGIADSESAESFLNPSYENDLHDPFLLHDMEKAVTRLLTAITNKEQIVIYSDYDCDGIPGGVILHDFFKAIGYEQFQNYIPHRHFEGFGLNSEAVEKLAAEGAKLLITIDCGTADIEIIAQAKKLGVDVIVSDHHEPKEELPTAVAIVNPKVGDSYPFSGLCGSGVVYKLIQATLTRAKEERLFTLPPGWEKWWLDMVAVATIADMVPLRDENRALVHYGIQVLRKSRRPGLQHLLRKNRMNQRFLTEDDVGFTIGPRINAASRMDTPEDAFMMLAATDEEEAGARVAHLEKLNTERKTTVATMTRELHKRLKETIDIPDVIVMGNPDWKPSLVGLAANKLAEEHGRPAFIWGRDGKGIIKGSCRSGGGVSVLALMEGKSNLFIEHGGHHVAGGFAVHEEHIYTLPSALNELFEEMGERALVQEELLVDASLTLDQVDDTLLRILRDVAPFGAENPKPLFEFRNVSPTRVDVFGKTKEHTKLIFETPNGSLEAIAFFMLPERFSKKPEVEKPVTLLGHVESSYFMNRLQTRIRIIDIM